MSDDFINQLTLNFLISKNQLNKLNKKVKENAENTRKTDKEIYGPRIKKLFDDLLVNEPPEILLQEVKTGFDYFIDKSIYYFKALDNNELLEKERTDDYPSNHIIHDDIDYEKDYGHELYKMNHANKIIDELMEIINKKIKDEMNIINPRIIIMMSEGLHKLSLHITYPDIYFTSIYTMGHFVKDIQLIDKKI